MMGFSVSVTILRLAGRAQTEPDGVPGMLRAQLARGGAAVLGGGGPPDLFTTARSPTQTAFL